MTRKLEKFEKMSAYALPRNFHHYKIEGEKVHGKCSGAIFDLIDSGHEFVEVKIERNLNKPDVVHIRK